MFEIGDIVRDKNGAGPNNIIYYGIVTYAEHNLIKVQWLNWEGPTIPIFQSDAQKWWEKVEE